MSTNLNYKQVANVTRRTWDVETYEKKAKARAENEQIQEEETSSAVVHTEEEFTPAQAGAAGPEGSKRAFLKARSGQVDIDSKIGTTEIIAGDAAATLQQGVSKDGVVKTGVGWHCKVCDCFLKDSHTYLDHINGKKHQRKLGYSMRVERSTKDDVLNALSSLSKKKKEDEQAGEIQETSYEDVVKEKDEELKRRKEERKKRRQERKKRAQEQPEVEETEVGDNEEEVEVQVDPALAAMMGFSSFG
jgi:U4/U6.U5 tri-snRNP component SNU23